jgi:hypothetical protein
MSKEFEKINETLDIEPTSVVKEIIKDTKKEIKKIENLKNKEEPEIDYEYVRGTLYSLIEKGQEAASSLLELAQDGQQPRAYEVFGQLIKNVADSTDKLMDIHQKMKELKKEDSNNPKSVTNALFVGSTAELQKLLKNGLPSSDNSK